MARFLILARRNPAGPWPDIVETLKLWERGWGAIDHFIETGLVKEFGWSLDARSAYGMVEGQSEHAFRIASMFMPHWESGIHEILPYEKGKEILTEVIKAAQ